MTQFKLLILNDNDFNSGFGGQASFIKNLHPYLEKEFELTYLNLPPIFFKQHIIPIRLLYLLRVFFFLIRRKKRVNFILSHTPEASFVASFFNLPFIHIFHGNTNALEKSVFWYGKYLKGIFRFFEKRIIKKSSLLYTVGDYRPDAKKFYNPIEISSPLVKTNSNRGNGFVFAGRLEELKNVASIISIYSNLPENIKEKHKLEIIGTGTQEGKLKKLAHTLNLEDKVIFHGLVKNDKAIEIISQSAILLMASMHEGFPMVIAESLTVGTPIISTDVGDIRSVVKNDYNGYLLPLGFSIDEYADKIIRLLENYDSFSQNAIKSSAIFDAKEIASSFIADCRSILN